MPTVAFHTFGCRLNQSETATLTQCVKAKGFEVVDVRKKPADIIIVNTCTVTENGDSDTRKLLGKYARRLPGAKIALIGCQAQMQSADLRHLPNVRWVIGTARKMEVADIITEHPDPAATMVLTPLIMRKSFTMPCAGIDSNRTRANLKIQDGCDDFCSFCIIPFARGRARSRQYQDIMDEAKKLVQAHHREIVLTGVNIGRYQDDGKNFCDLIKELAGLDGLKRLRISSIEPTTITDEIIEAVKSNQKICPYLHIPLQSGSAKILKSMNRNYSPDRYARLIARCAKEIPDVCLGTDVIVGFPGETDSAFDQTRAFLENLPMAYFHVFSYSERSLAKSRNFSHQNDRDIISRRSGLLRRMSADKRRMFLRKYVGKSRRVLFENKKGDYWSGFTDNYMKVKVCAEENLGNQLLPVKFGSLSDDALIGDVHAS